jgi:hypothetical protein
VIGEVVRLMDNVSGSTDERELRDLAVSLLDA